MRPPRLIFLAIVLSMTGMAQADQTAAPPVRDKTVAQEQPRVLAMAPPLRPAVQARLKLAQSRPALRPESAQQAAFSARPGDLALLGPLDAGRPFLRPPELIERIMAKRRAQKKGAVCGDVDIQGEEVGYVPGRIQACGIKDAVRVRSVSGVALSTQSLMNCRTAKALKTWIDTGIQPAFKANGGVSKLKVAAHYACRTRNNRPGARISEHGKGNAIDISAFFLRDGTTVTLLKGWNSKHGKALRRIHRAACGPFGTVLGPESDRYHKDHFHVDTARYRSGPFCR